jgi:FkbM family methyltransferase
MRKFNNIPEIICITTDNNTRLENFINQCIKYNIYNYTIISFAKYNPNDFKLTGQYIDKLADNSKGPLTSHIKAIKKWYDTSSESQVLVFEDDIDLSISDKWNFTLEEFIKMLPANWECVQLCCIRESFNDIGIKFRLRLNGDFGCQAYLLSRQYAKKIIDNYYIDEYAFNIDLKNTLIQTAPNTYDIYDLFPIVENTIFEGKGIVYNFPLFTEDSINTSSNFQSGNDDHHLNSRNFILNWWQTIGFNAKLNNIFDYKNPVTVVQLGAHNGKDNLNKYLIQNYKQLKFGLFVEANPIHIEDLKNNYRYFNNVVIDNIAIKKFTDINKSIEIFYHDQDPDKQVASYDIEHVKKHEKYWQNGNINSFKIQAMTIEQLFDKYNLTTIDWLLLDIEGMEKDVLLNINLKKYKIKRIEFEKLHLDDLTQDILLRLSSYGYKKIQSLHEYDWAFELDDSLYNNDKDIYTAYALDPDNDELNFNLACRYHQIGHTASAFSHYLRCAERTKDNNLMYECLLRGYLCFEAQGNRNFTSLYLLKQAISLMPKRPEAYYLICKYYELRREWYDEYLMSSMAIDNIDDNYISLRTDVGYPGRFIIYLQKAISARFWDKQEESRKLYNFILEKYGNISQNFIDIVYNNLLEIEKQRQQHKIYNSNRHVLKFKFEGLNNIDNNFSQCFQDLFILAAYNGKQNGTYLEIGAGHYSHGNNTYLLEQKYNWTGISVEINKNLTDEFSSYRKNSIIQADASAINYRDLLSQMNTNHIDYLQLDCDPPSKTFEILLSIPFDKYKFGIITYEHDYYLDLTKSFRDKSRKYLENLGYQLIVNDVSIDDSTPFEDWWVHPDLIEKSIIDKLQNKNLSKINAIEKYILNT